MAKPGGGGKIGDLSRLGIFSEGSYLSVGDPYVKPRDDKEKSGGKVDRDKGKQFVTAPPRRGKTNDAFFEKQFRALLVGEPYVDAAVMDRGAKKASKGKNIVPAGFRPVGGAKKSSGSGSYFGTIGGKVEHMDESPKKSRDADPKSRAAEKPQMKTSPPKKGSFGTSGITIGKGVEYQSEPFEAARELDKKDKEKELTLRKGSAFHSTVHGQGVFDGKVYSIDPKLQGLPKGSEEKKKKSDEAATKIFRPSSPSKSGHFGTLSKFPEYSSDLFEKKEKVRPKDETKAAKVFMPPSGPKSTITRSIARMSSRS